MLDLKSRTAEKQIFFDSKLPKFLSAVKQKTLAVPLDFKGIGLHTGNGVKMKLSPAPIDTGIVFRRKINGSSVRIKANYNNVKSTKLCTLISDDKGNSISTVEHILSALYAYEIDNIFIDLDSNEIPVYDGSAIEFVNQIEQAGFEEQDSYKKFIKIKKNVEVRNGNKLARVSPFVNTLITTEINYDHKLIGKQTISLLLTSKIYQSQICSASFQASSSSNFALLVKINSSKIRFCNPC